MKWFIAIRGDCVWSDCALSGICVCLHVDRLILHMIDIVYHYCHVMVLIHIKFSYVSLIVL